MDEVRKHPERGYQILDTLHRQSLEKLVAQFSIKGLSEADLHYLTMGWHRLHAWPDSVPGLTRLKTKYIISPLSNGNVALLTNMAKFAGLPWDLVMSAELFEHYKPDPETYLGAAKLLCLPPEQVMMVAAHNNDLKAAQKLGLKTAFVARPTEYGPHQKYDFEAKGDWDIVAKDFGGIADRLGCYVPTRDSDVGWVERSETHHLRTPGLMGIAALHPSYALAISAPRYPAPPWITPNQPRPLYVS